MLLVAPLITALAVLGGLGSFTTVRELAEPHFKSLAWIVPVGMDLGILILLAWDLLMEYLDLPWPVLRWVAWAYIGGTVLVNVSAAHGQVAGSVMYAAMPVLFVTVVEGVRHLIRRWAGLASGRRVERVPTARWLLAPVSSLLLWRRMVLWHVTAYQDGLTLEYRHLLAVSRLQEQYGRWAWRWDAPLGDRLALRRLPVGLDADGRLEGDPSSTAEQASEDELLVAARRVQREARRRGVRVTRNYLGDRLRELGHPIGTARLQQLLAALRNDSAQGGRG
ncbi:integral membrane protein [Actinomadura verrucosospora]|uniref:Integral membrane protein n=1 Tax=Actinomadura verrucosospora TaxID=46165 RepID=A0A7D3ZJW4_ACTVE|nr:integral membrane protein [Actinomadura verrucosospora]